MENNLDVEELLLHRWKVGSNDGSRLRGNRWAGLASMEGDGWMSHEEDFGHGRWRGSWRSVDGRFWEGKEIVYSDLNFRREGMEDFGEWHIVVEHCRISRQNRAPTMCVDVYNRIL
jgi:hypothetical protein